MKRRRAREYALQILFQLDVTKNQFSSNVLEDFWKNLREEEEEIRQFANDIVTGTRENIREIDDVINRTAEHWSLSRIAVVDRNILRAATYELLYRTDIPSSVVMNEAIEISKKYSTGESASFINGILDKIAKNAVKKLKTT